MTAPSILGPCLGQTLFNDDNRATLPCIPFSGQRVPKIIPYPVARRRISHLRECPPHTRGHCMKSWLWPSLIRIKSVVKFGPLSLTHESKVLRHFLHWLWHNFDSRQSYHAFDSSQRWAKVALMHALAIIWQNLWSLLIRVKIKSKMAFDSRQKWSKVSSNMAFDNVDVLQRRGVKAIFRAGKRRGFKWASHATRIQKPYKLKQLTSYPNKNNANS